MIGKFVNLKLTGMANREKSPSTTYSPENMHWDSTLKNKILVSRVSPKDQEVHYTMQGDFPSRLVDSSMGMPSAGRVDLHWSRIMIVQAVSLKDQERHDTMKGKPGRSALRSPSE